MKPIQFASIAGLCLLFAIIMFTQTHTDIAYFFLSVASSAGLCAFALGGANGFTKTLAAETRDALAENQLKMNGLRDHIKAFESEIDLFRKDIGEFQSHLGEDEFKKFSDRLSVLELSAGMRPNSARQVRSNQ